MHIKVLVACRQEDQARFICANLVRAAGGTIAAEATPVAGALGRAEDGAADVLLLEHARLEEERTWDVLARLARAGGNTRVLLLCDAYTPQTVIECIAHGASGCLPGSSGPSLHAKAVVAVHQGQGESWFGRTALLQALRSQVDCAAGAPSSRATSRHRPPPQPDRDDDLDPLTPREREILGLVGNALSNKEIARRLRISDKTVKTHLHHIYVKLHQSGRYKAFVSSATQTLH